MSGGLPARVDREPSVRQQRYRLTLIAPEQYRPRDGGGAEAVADAVERLVDRVPTLEGEDELDVGSVLEVGEGDAEQGQALAVDRRHDRREQRPRRGEDGLGLLGGVGERVRSGRTREVLEAQAQHHGPADAAGGAQPAGDAVDDPDEDRIELSGRAPPAPERVLR